MPRHTLTAAAVRLGFYGKIPSRGDFVRCGLSRGLVAGWDGWARSVLAEVGRQEWGAAAWDAAPVWRLSLDAGLCGPSPVLGVMVASVDRSGRRFPLLCAAEGVGEVPDQTGLIEDLERIGRGAVETGSTPEDLRAALGALRVPDPGIMVTGRGCGRWWRSGAEWTLDLPHMPDAETVLQLLLA